MVRQTYLFDGITFTGPALNCMSEKKNRGQDVKTWKFRTTVKEIKSNEYLSESTSEFAEELA